MNKSLCFYNFKTVIMIKHLIIRKVSLALLVSLPIIAIGQIETRKITFPAGKTSTTINSSVKGNQTIDYKVYANKGQVLTVKM